MQLLASSSVPAIKQKKKENNCQYRVERVTNERRPVTQESRYCIINPGISNLTIILDLNNISHSINAQFQRETSLFYYPWQITGLRIYSTGLSNSTITLDLITFPTPYKCSFLAENIIFYIPGEYTRFRYIFKGEDCEKLTGEPYW